jgi:hypothetical protein
LRHRAWRCGISHRPGGWVRRTYGGTAGGGLGQTGEDTEGGGLAGTVGAEENVKPTAPAREVETVDRPDPAEMLVQFNGLDEGVHNPNVLSFTGL